MNIITVRPDGSWYCRPDTTLKWVARDLYLPDGISHVVARRCLFFRIEKGAKAVAQRFAGRYCNSYGPGVTLYGNGTEPNMDDTTQLFRERCQPYQELAPDMQQCFARLLEAVTHTTSMRLGDVLVIETSEGEKTLRTGDTADLYSDEALCFNIL